MNIRRSGLMMALLFAVAVAIGFWVPSALAFVAVQSNTLVNTFDAPYITPDETRVEVRVHKTVHSTGESTIGPEGFQFLLENTDNGEYITLTADPNGIASVILPFSDADVSRVHHYRLNEINDGRQNVVYSDTVYLIDVTVSVNERNELIASLKLNNAPVDEISVAFANTYISQNMPPLTGDDSHPLMYLALMLLSGACAAALLRRRAQETQ